ncbi:MAG: hypothetical protein E6Q68_04600 [Polynucleobacter sp.]|nr:MAG: hypothetical protein E6Q68_04600 [Polynucleobacter sp.]
MARETLYVTMANGTKVPFDEFSKWSNHKQRMMTDHPIRNIEWDVNHCDKMRRIVKEQYESGMRTRPGNWGASNGQSIAVITPQGQFQTLKAAAKSYDIDVATLKEWLVLCPQQFSYANPLSDEDRKKLQPGVRAVLTPAGRFESIAASARHYEVGVRTIKTWIRTMRKDEFKYIENK